MNDTTRHPRALHLTATREDVIDAFVEVAGVIILAGATRTNRCILATRVTVEVLRHFGVPAEPLVVRADAMNAEFAQILQEAMEAGWSVEETWAKAAAHGTAYSVGIGYEGGSVGFGGGPSFPGHLVALADDVLVDSSIIQANRPHRGIDLPTVVAAQIPNMSAFLGVTHPLWLRFDGKASVSYYRLLPAPEFRNAADWHDERLWGPIAREVIRVLEASLR